MNQYVLWMDKWPVIYGIGICCGIGLLCKILASFACMSMSRQITRLARGKSVEGHRVSRALISGYKRAMEQKQEIADVGSYIEEAVAGAKVGGINIYQLENINLVTMVASFTLGAVGSMIAFLNGGSDEEILFVFAAGLAFTGLSVAIEVLFRNDYHRMMYFIGMENYLNNVVANEYRKGEERAKSVVKMPETHRVKNQPQESFQPTEKRQQQALLEVAAGKDAAVKGSVRSRENRGEWSNENSSEIRDKRAEKTAVDTELLEDFLRSFLM